MIPTNEFSQSPIAGDFKAPFNRPFHSTYCFLPGGKNIGDPSEGRNSKVWICEIKSTGLWLRREDDASIEVQINSETTPTMVSAAFDANMNPVVAWQIGSTSYIRYFSGVSSSYVVVTRENTTSCKVVVDDVREQNIVDSDIIFAFTTGTDLRYTMQREVYVTERVAGLTTKKIRRAGMSELNRLQFELG